MSMWRQIEGRPLTAAPGGREIIVSNRLPPPRCTTFEVVDPLFMVIDVHWINN